MPARFQVDALEWFEEWSGERPAGIRQQVLGYMYTNSYGETADDDILLLRYRYDSAKRTIYDVEGGEPIAELRSDSGEPVITDGISLNTHVMDANTAAAFVKALRIGFHACDTRSGVDHCMRRLAWLASEYYLNANDSKKTTLYVLKRDAENPAELTGLIVR